MAITWLYVVTFGVLGVSSRFALDLWVAKWALSFPIATFFINIAGGFIAGFIMGIGLQKDLALDPLRLGLIAGFCGGFTTMSGFGLQFVQLINEGKISSALIYGIGSPLLCILFVFFGILISRILTT